MLEVLQLLGLRNTNFSRLWYIFQYTSALLLKGFGMDACFSLFSVNLNVFVITDMGGDLGDMML